MRVEATLLTACSQAFLASIFPLLAKVIWNPTDCPTSGRFSISTLIIEMEDRFSFSKFHLVCRRLNIQKTRPTTAAIAATPAMIHSICFALLATFQCCLSVHFLCWDLRAGPLDLLCFFLAEPFAVLGDRSPEALPWLCSVSYGLILVAKMKTPEYIEGPESKKNFERFTSALLQVPKAGTRRQARKATARKDSGKNKG